MGMSIDEACKFVFDNWAAGVKSYNIAGNVIKLVCKSKTGRSTYPAEIVIKNAGKAFEWSCAYNANAPRQFASMVCQMITKGKITH